MLDKSGKQKASSLGAWDLPEELQQLRDTVRRFMVNEVKPVEDRLEHDAVSCGPQDLKSLQAKAKNLGLWMMRTPGEYGGAGLNLLGQAIVAEEAAKCRMGAYIPALNAFGSDPPNVIWLGSKYQIEKYGLTSVNEGKKAFFAISEASGGADPGRAIKCQAVLKGDRYVLNGTKMWITGAKGADWGIVFARTGHGGRGGITSFIVDGNMKGISYKVIPVIRAYAPYEVHFDNVEVPVENLVGEENKGWDYGKFLLGNERTGIARIGASKERLRRIRQLASQVQSGGKPIIEDQRFLEKLTAVEIELKALEMNQMRVVAGEKHREKGKPDPASSILKIKGSELQQATTELMMDVIGPFAAPSSSGENDGSNEADDWTTMIAPGYFNYRKVTIYGGSNEIQRNIIAKAVLGL